MPTFDAHANFAFSTIVIAPSPAISGTTLQVKAGNGANFPATPFNATVAPYGVISTQANSEVIRVTNISGDQFTFLREQEGSTPIAMLVGMGVFNSDTAKVFTDIELAVNAETTTGDKTYGGEFGGLGVSITPTPGGPSTWMVNGIGTDGSIIDFEDGTTLQLAGEVASIPTFDEEVPLNTYQTSTHAALGDVHYCVDVHLNNTAYMNSTHLSINGGSSVAIAPHMPIPTQQQVPLMVTFTSNAVRTITNPQILAYDPVAPITGPLGDMNIYAFEQGNLAHTAWLNINGVPQVLSARSGGSVYTWYLAISASPTKGEPKLFGLQLLLNWL